MPDKTAAAEAPAARRKKRSQWQDVVYRFKKSKLAVIGVAMLAALILVTVISGFFINYEVDVIKQNVTQKLLPPSLDHPFGTDHYGRDLLARILYGARYSLSIGVVVIFFALGGGLVIGSVAGYFGGRADNILMRVVDMFIAMPPTLFAIAVVSALGPGIVNLSIAIILAYIPAYARIMRSTVLSVKDMDYVEAARAQGAGHLRIIAKHILPSALPPLIVQATLGVGYVILQASALSFLGLGIMPPDPEWGAILSEGGRFMRQSPWMVIFSGAAIIYVVISLNIIGDGLRDALDPKMKD